MMSKYSFVFLLFCFFSSCSTNPEIIEITNEIKALDGFDKQSKYLENIYALDQGIRGQLSSVERQYGYQSPQLQEVYREMREIDNLNLLKIEKYLELKGHPAKDIHSNSAVNTPYIVYHHQSGKKVRKRGFKHLYKAYLNGNMDKDGIAFYLNRSYYDITNGQRIEWNRPYRVDEELDTLYKLLDLLPIIEEIKKSN